MSWEEDFRRNIERTRQRIMEIAPDMLDLKAHRTEPENRYDYPPREGRSPRQSSVGPHDALLSAVDEDRSITALSCTPSISGGRCGCTFPTIKLRTTSKCATLDVHLRELHCRAYTYAKTAQRTLLWLAGESDARAKVIWNYGVGTNALWVGEVDPAPTGLGFWFGPFSHSKPVQILSIFSKLVSVFETGVEVLGLSRPILYRCKSSDCVGGAIARHLVPEIIEICPIFWSATTFHAAPVRAEVLPI